MAEKMTYEEFKFRMNCEPGFAEKVQAMAKTNPNPDRNNQLRHAANKKAKARAKRKGR